jgi:hypothetical protein
MLISGGSVDIMNVSVNIWAVLLAAVSSMVIGSIYYAKPVFGRAWMKLGKIDEKRFEKEMPKKMLGVFVAALITAEVTGYFTFLYHYFFINSWIIAGLTTSLILWLVAMSTLFIHNSLDQRPANLTYLSMGNRLASLLAMGLIIGLLHP